MTAEELGADHKHTFACSSCGLTEALVGDDGRPTPAGWREIGRRLALPFKTFRAPGRGGSYDYITARQVGLRLDQVLGPGNWELQLRVVRAEPPVVVQAAIAIYGVRKEGIGYSNNPDQVDEFIPELDRNRHPIIDPETKEPKLVRNPNFEAEPLKAAESDAVKRAGVHWGMGRSLYKEMRE